MLHYVLLLKQDCQALAALVLALGVQIGRIVLMKLLIFHVKGHYGQLMRNAVAALE